jgi:hypothetical protein
MHPSFKSVIIIGASGLHAFFMDIYHGTSLGLILEDDSISLESKAHIRSCLGKGTWLWLVVRPSIHLFCITHFIFTLALCFCLNLIQPLAFSLLTCECGQRFDAYDMHLAHCPFGGQRIATHDAIQNVMYTLAQESGHVVWRERWYVLTSRVSLQADLYMTRED